MKNARLFIHNGLILTASSLLLRTVGVSFNVFITSKTGAEGTGLYQLVMSVYSPALTLASAGVSLASSRLVAEEISKKDGQARGVFFKCMIYAFLFSVPVAAALFILSPYISQSWLGNIKASYLLKMLSLGLPFIAMSSCINGFFTAIRRVSKSAITQLSEQFFKMALTYTLICLTEENATLTLLCVVFGNVCSDIFSFILSFGLCKGETRQLKDDGICTESVTPRILNITLPVSISSFLRSSLIALEHILIPKGLKKSGIPYADAMASYGTLSGMAMPIILFPASFLYSFSSLTVPELAEAKEKGENDEISKMIKQVLFSFLLFSLGSAAFILGYSSELAEAIYKNEEVSVYLTYLSPLIPFMYLDTAVDSMLKGLGEQIYTMKVNVIDAIISVISVYFLVPKMGIMGYVAVILISELINFSFSIYRLKKVTGVKLGLLRGLSSPLLAVGIAVIFSRYITFFIKQATVKAITGIGVGVLTYIFLLLLFGCIKGIKKRDLPYNEAKERRGLTYVD